MRPKIHHRGFAGYWLMAGILGLCALLATGVETGRVHMVKAELYRAADSAARAGAGSIRDGLSEATGQACRQAFLHKSNGLPVELDPVNDIEFGTWDAMRSTFTRLPSSQIASSNAVRVIARRSEQRGTAVQLVFGRMIGYQACDVSAESIAMVVPEMAGETNKRPQQSITIR